MLNINTAATLSTFFLMLVGYLKSSQSYLKSQILYSCGRQYGRRLSLPAAVCSRFPGTPLMPADLAALPTVLLTRAIAISL